ncbi:hypothetical protein LP418_09705 [Nocardioides sp. B-3]|nr:hypothetical protein [Nocardioides sp. B-3]UUZ60939.1 hypothetical protein LP418_09705 [Nocardioides sp. B-3]
MVERDPVELCGPGVGPASDDAVGADPHRPVDAEGDRQQVDDPVERLARVGGQLLDHLEVRGTGCRLRRSG